MGTHTILRNWPSLTIITIICLAQFACKFSVNSGSGGGGTSLPIAQQGAEQWTIDGKTYRIKSTYYLRMPTGALQYTVEYLCDDCTKILEGITEEKAIDATFPLMKYAYERGIYNRSQISKSGTGELKPTQIGVAITQKNGAHEKGYRVAQSLTQIASRVDGGSPAAP